MYLILCIIVELLLFNGISSHSTGAPPSACESMTPSHGVSPQSGISPFTIKAGTSYYTQSTSVNITIEASGSKTFKGLLLQAREVNKNAAFGTFVNLPTGLKYVKCNNNLKGAVTHSNAGAWKSLEISWLPPADISATGNISFFVTVVQSYDTFWVKLETSQLNKMDTIMPSVQPKPVPMSTLPTMKIMRTLVKPSKPYSVKMTSTVTVTDMKYSVQPSNSSKVVMSSTAAKPTSCPAEKCGAHAFVPDTFVLILSLGVLAIALQKLS